jgi:transcriptional regulator with XRE-family HTH domain
MRSSALRFHGPAARAIRERSGVSVAELAASIGRNAAYVSRLELGQRQPSPATLQAICTRLSVTLDQVTYSEVAA